MLKQSLDITEYFLVTQEEFDNYLILLQKV